MNEIFPKVNPTPGDEKKMEQVLYKAKEILADVVADDREKKINTEKVNENFPKLNPTPEDEEKMEDVFNEAKMILTRAAEDDKKRKNKQALEEFDLIDDNYDKDFLEDDKPSKEELEEIENTVKKIEKELKDESSDFYTNTDRGSVDELFYRTLAEEVPSLNLSISEEAFDMDDHLLKNCVAVKTVPYKTDREFVFDLADNDIIYALRNPEFYPEKKVKELEKSGKVPKDFYRRAVARQYEYYAKKWPDDSLWQERFAKFKDVTPFSDEEIREIMRKIILEELKERLNGD